MSFITNNKKEKQKTLGARLSWLIEHGDRLDMLVGFFYFSGIKAIYQSLLQRPQLTMRVLVGMEAELLTGRLIETIQEAKDQSADGVKERFLTSMQKVLGSSVVDIQAFHERLELFIEMLETKRLEIRKTCDPNHAKLYIFTMDEEQAREKFWITGSSNFSDAGLTFQDELNVEIADFGGDEAQAYFDGLWKKAVPLTDTDEDRWRLIEILRTASVAAAVTPYEAYYLVLKQFLEFQKSQLNEERLDRLLKEAHFNKFRYQVDAVAQAIQRLDQYRGVIIADVVGLGKSVIASLIGGMRRRRGLIICPPGLMGEPSGEAGGWYEYVRTFQLQGWEVWSRGQLDKLSKMLVTDSDFDMVIVDEAHNFRNEDTEDYGLLANICFGREVVLLSATPFNNQPSDLLALLKLFLPAKNGPLGDLERQFRLYQNKYKRLTHLQKLLANPVPDWPQIHTAQKACGISILIPKVATDLNVARHECSKRLKRLTDDVRQVMEKVVIRRNRLDLTNDPDYRDEITTLSTVEPPKEQFFELTEEQNVFYDKVIHEYFGEDGNFHGAMYHPQDYLKNKDHDDSQLNIYLMLRRQMVQRFESSFGAFRNSVENVLKSMETAKKFIARSGMYIYARELMEKMLLIEDDADLYLAINEYAQKQAEQAKLSGNKAHKKATADDFRYNMRDSKFNGEEFLKHLDEDIASMKQLLEEFDALKLKDKDPKAKHLVEVIKQVLNNQHANISAEPHSPRRKVLVFSSYADTIKHIATYVEKAFPNKVVKITGENFGLQNAAMVKANFDASSKNQKDDYDILLATDKLSEGFNLNRSGVVINYDIPWNPTRVIQRVGRINRIGKKVFDKLYIFNFFPTVKGSAVVSNRAVAESKMFAIHQILGEDTQIFALDEDPTPSALYDKLNKLDAEETISFYTAMKLKFQKEKAFLEKKHPEILERIERFPNMIKTAWTGNKTQPHVTFMFKRFGTTFSVIAHTKKDNNISEWTLDEALGQIECEYETPAEKFTSEFWQYPTWDPNKDKGTPRGVYEALKQYEPEGLSATSGIPDAVQAVNVIARLRSSFTIELNRFAAMVAEDIQSYGTIPLRTIRQLAKCERMKDVKAATAELMTILEELRNLRGDDYLEPVRKQAASESILVTIEKH